MRFFFVSFSAVSVTFIFQLFHSLLFFPVHFQLSRISFLSAMEASHVLLADFVEVMTSDMSKKTYSVKILEGRKFLDLMLSTGGSIARSIYMIMKKKADTRSKLWKSLTMPEVPMRS